MSAGISPIALLLGSKRMYDRLMPDEPATKEEMMDAFRALGWPTTEAQVATVAGGSRTMFAVERKPTSAELAKITKRCGNREVNLLVINEDLFFLAVGGGGTVHPPFPRLGNGVNSVDWVGHTHPLENKDDSGYVQGGPTPADEAALKKLHKEFGYAQTSSIVFACRAGAVVAETVFELEGAALERMMRQLEDHARRGK